MGENKEKGCVVAGSSVGSVDSVAITGGAEGPASSAIVTLKSPKEPRTVPVTVVDETISRILGCYRPDPALDITAGSFFLSSFFGRSHGVHSMPLTYFCIHRISSMSRVR